MRPIPPKLRNEMANDPYYKQCCISWDGHVCEGRIEFHHNLIYAGKQVNAKSCILPICQSAHRKADLVETREKLDLVMITRMSLQERVFYSKSRDLNHRYNYLSAKYGTINIYR